jgi:uncharacterized protein (DUF433 family)
LSTELRDARHPACDNEGIEKGVDWQERISFDPKVMGGKRVIRGTCVPVEIIVGSLAGGDSVINVGESYRLGEADARAALAYAADLVSQERVRALLGG